LHGIRSYMSHTASLLCTSTEVNLFALNSRLIGEVNI